MNYANVARNYHIWTGLVLTLDFLAFNWSNLLIKLKVIKKTFRYRWDAGEVGQMEAARPVVCLSTTRNSWLRSEFSSLSLAFFGTLLSRAG